MSSNPYEILEIPNDADQAAIKKAYFEKIKQFTPDKDPENFKKVRGAYEAALKACKSNKKVGKFRVMTFEKEKLENPLIILRQAREEKYDVSINKFIKITF